MNTYDPEELKSAKRSWVTWFHEMDSYAETQESRDSYIEVDDNEDPNEVFSFEIPGGAEIEYTISEFINLVHALEKGELIENRLFISPLITVCRCEPVNDKAQLLYEWIAFSSAKKARVFIKNVEYKGIKVRICLTWGVTEFTWAFYKKIDKHVDYDDFGYYPSEHGEIFVEIISTEELNMDTILLLLNCYLYELHASENMCIEPKSREFAEDWFIHREEHESPITGSQRLREIFVDIDLSELFDLYNDAVRASNTQIKILLITKIFEYISATVTRLNLFDNVKQYLWSPHSLKPDSNFILALGEVYRKQQHLIKDKEAIKSTFLECCNAIILSDLAPGYLDNLKNISSISNPKKQNKALEELAYSLYATRNQIAHAKANYTPTGEECPPDQLNTLVNCLVKATDQAIQWFAHLDPKDRVTHGKENVN